MRNGNAETETGKLYEREGVEWYREKIVEMVNGTDDLKYLEFIHKLLLSFKKKWGV